MTPATTPPRPWQRQPGESPQDFQAFVAYLRAPGRRTHRAASVRSGRTLGAIRRLSARFNWPARVAAFDARLADATQDALDSVLRARPAAAKADLERLRESEYQLASQVIHESHRWLELASHPRRKLVPIGQICNLIDLAFKLARLAAGMPLDASPRRHRKEDLPGYWTGPSVEEALNRIYGSDAPPASPPAAPAASSPPAVSEVPSAPGLPGNQPLPPAFVNARHGQTPSPPALTASMPTAPAASAPPETPLRRRDAWSSWAAHLRRKRS